MMYAVRVVLKRKDGGGGGGVGWVGSLVWGLYFFSNTPYLIQCFRENAFLKTSVNIGICLCLSVLLHY